MKDVDASIEGNPLDALAEEFVERYRRGERPALSDYIARQPELAEGIRDLFPALVMMENARPASGRDSEGLVGVGTASGMNLERLGDYRIVPVFGVGEHDGLHYHVMQFIQGLGLDEVLVEVVRLRNEKQSSTKSGKRGSAGFDSHTCGVRAVSHDGCNAVAPSAIRVAEGLISGQFQRAADSDRGREDRLSSVSPPAKPYGRFSRIRLSR